MREDVIPTALMDTRLASPDEQFGIWARHTANTRLAPLRAGSFTAVGAFWDLGQVAVTQSVLDGFVATRDDALVRATGADHYLLIALFKGDTRFEAPGLDDHCGPGDAFICDFTRTSILTTQGVSCATVMLPRSFVRGLCDDVVLHGRLPGGAAVRVLVDMLRSLTRNLPGLPQSSAPFHSRVIRDLLVAAAASMPRLCPDPDPSRRDRVIAWLKMQPPGELAIGRLLGDLGITRATLYRLFGNDGGVISYDRTRRLRALHQNLADPLERRNIAELGRAHGFVDPASLARMFRGTFGYSMSTLRRRMSELARPMPETSTADKLRIIVEAMRSQ